MDNNIPVIQHHQRGKRDIYNQHTKRTERQKTHSKTKTVKKMMIKMKAMLIPHKIW
jgi:hypothetical protein